MEWIRTQDALPADSAEGVEVIVSIKDSRATTVLTYFEGEFFDSEGNVYNVTHWQHLPESPNK